MKLRHEQIQYVEFLSNDLQRIKKFYADSFGWKFTDYGPEYAAFEGDHIDGGFTLGQAVKGSVLVILFSEKLEETKKRFKRPAAKLRRIFSIFPEAGASNSLTQTAMNWRFGRKRNRKPFLIAVMGLR